MRAGTPSHTSAKWIVKTEFCWGGSAPPDHPFGRKSVAASEGQGSTGHHFARLLSRRPKAMEEDDSIEVSSNLDSEEGTDGDDIEAT